MKKVFLALFALTLLLLSTSLVAADIEMTTDANETIQIDQDVLDDDEEEITVSYDLDFENTGSGNESNYSEVSFSVSSSNSDFTVDIDGDDTFSSVEPGDSISITVSVTADISSGIDSGIYEDIITLEISGTGEDYGDGSSPSGFSASQSLDVEMVSMLEIEDGYLYIDGDLEETIDADDADDDDADLTVTPGDEVSFFFHMINRFDGDYRHGDMEVEITVEMDDDDFGDDVDEDSDIEIEVDSEVDDGDEDQEIKFRVPTEAEAKDYEFTVTFEAEDENGAKYTDEWIIVLEVEREDDDVRIESASFAQTPICGESPRFTVKAINFGEDRQRDMIMTLQSATLDIEMSEEFDIEEGTDEDDNEVNINFYVEIPKDAKGSHDFRVEALYDDSDFADREIVTVDITCVEEETVEQEEDTTEVIVLPSSQPDATTTSAAATTTTTSTTGNAETTTADRVVTVEKSYTIQDTQLGLTIVLIILVLLALIALLVVGLKRKN